jgi:hypothetical protein
MHRFEVHDHSMKAIRKRKALTLGEFVVLVYDACGKRQATGIIRLAVNAHVVAFPGRRHLIIS